LNSLVDRFRLEIEHGTLIPTGSRLLVGYSGGADSTCMLHMLALAGVDVVAAYLHHGQRDEADEELRKCEEFATKLAIPFVSGRADVPRMARDLGIGLEEAGREARYGFFRQAAHRLECDLIATAHTRNDFVETMLLNLTRGSGMAGLSGIPERRENIVRPLLAFTREETRSYCEEHGFWFHEDPSNSDLQFSRARIRHRVLPELRAINPAAESAFTRFANVVQEEDRFLNGMAAAALEQAEIPLNGELRFLSLDAEVGFDRATLASLPPVLFRRAVRLAAQALGSSLNHEQTLLLTAGVAVDEKGSVTTDGGEVVFEWNHESVHGRKLKPTSPFRYGLTIPGETISEEFGWCFVAYRQPYDGAAPARTALDVQLDVKKTTGTLYFRTAQPGDQMSPLGFTGHRKLSDLISEAGLTTTARTRLPIVCDMIGPVWAPGVCLENRVRPLPETNETLRITFRPMEL